SRSLSVFPPAAVRELVLDGCLVRRDWSDHRLGVLGHPRLRAGACARPGRDDRRPLLRICLWYGWSGGSSAGPTGRWHEPRVRLPAVLVSSPYRPPHRLSPEPGATHPTFARVNGHSGFWVPDSQRSRRQRRSQRHSLCSLWPLCPCASPESRLMTSVSSPALD